MADGVDARASDRERDDAVTELQIAFAEGRLDDAEFDTRVRGALAAKTRSELDRLAADLPRENQVAGVAGGGLQPARARKPGKLSLAYKTSLRRAGRWRVPAKFIAVSYKGGGTVLDLRAAELTSAVTTIRAVAYKCRIQVLAPPGIRVEVSGIGVSSGDDDPAALAVSAGAPVVHIRGLAYKGQVEVSSAPPSAVIS
jgi:Domain of unknown function (DUF1707)